MNNYNTKQQRLTKKQVEFITDYGNLIQKWNVPAVADMLGVKRQAVHYHLTKGDKNEK